MLPISPDGVLRRGISGIATVDWMLVLAVLIGPALVATGGYQSFEARRFFASSVATTAVITAMQDSSTQEGYHLCDATLRLAIGSTTAQAKVSVDGYWPETSRRCAKVADKLAVRYSLTDPTDVRPADTLGDEARHLIIVGLFFSLPLFVIGAVAFAAWRSHPRR